MSNKIIGIFGWKVTETSYGVTIPYLQYANQFGDVRILGIDEPPNVDLDLLIIPGGADINPNRYKAIPDYYTGKSDPIKEYQDTVILPEYIEMGIPIFGICRGMQTIAVHFGAGLVQNMYHETNENDRSDLVHDVDIVKIDGFTAEKISVNSLHHQCVSYTDFPECLEIVGVYRSKKKNGPYRNSIEIIKHRTLPIWGVQYHPEELENDPFGDKIINELLNHERVYV